MAARFWEEETFPSTKEQITRACFTVLRECRFAVTESDVAQGWIRARAPMGFRSWGENITITVRMNGNVEIMSECRLPTPIVDWGKNKAYENELVSKLRSALGS